MAGTSNPGVLEKRHADRGVLGEPTEDPHGYARIAHFRVDTTRTWCDVCACGPFYHSSASAQHLDDYLTSQFDRTVTISGIGLVTGLQQTGDVKGSIEAATIYAEQLARVGVPAALQAINKGQGIALVSVTAEIGANWVEGLEYDCQVSVAGGGAESLVGGQLWVTPMNLNLIQMFAQDLGITEGIESLQQRFPQLAGMIATAEGRVDVADAENQPTRGSVRRGIRVINNSPILDEARKSRQILFDVTNPCLADHHGGESIRRCCQSRDARRRVFRSCPDAFEFADLGDCAGWLRRTFLCRTIARFQRRC